MRFISDLVSGVSSMYDVARRGYERLFPTPIPTHDPDEMAYDIARAFILRDSGLCTDHHDDIMRTLGHFQTEDDLRREREKLQDYEF